MSEAGEAGFTLLELLVIVAILALIAGIGFPAVDRAGRRLAFVEAAGRLDRALHDARAQALRQDRPVRFALSADGRAYASGEAVARLDDPLVAAMPDGAILFYGDGSATGGRLVLRDPPWTRRWRVRRDTGEMADGERSGGERSGGDSGGGW